MSNKQASYSISDKTAESLVREKTERVEWREGFHMKADSSYTPMTCKMIRAGHLGFAVLYCR